MATKKSLYTSLITSYPSIEVFSKAWGGAFGEDECQLLSLDIDTDGVKSRLELAIVTLHYADMLGRRITFKGIDADDKHYEGDYDFFNHNECKVGRII